MKIANRIKNLGTETAFAVSAQAKEWADKGNKIYPFHLGDMNMSTPQNIIDAANKYIMDGKNGYCPSEGILPLREALAVDVGGKRGVSYNPDNVSVQPGGKPTIGKFIQAVMNPGDEVLYPNPGYPIYESQIEYHGGIAMPYSYDQTITGFAIDIEKLKSSITDKTTALIYNNYNNPIYSDHLLPYGSLREKKSELQRADIIITSKCPEMTPTEKIGINNQLNISSHQNSFFSSIIYNNWESIFTDEKISTNNKYHITLVTSVANADNLKLHLEENGHIVNHLSFPDHYNFTKTDIQNILSEYYSITSDKNIILSTEKDKVKLTNFKTEFDGIKLFFIPINIKIDREQEFNKLITDYVTNHKRNR